MIVEKKQIIGFKSEVNTKWEWNEYGNKDYHAMYVGEIKNGKPNIQGKLTISERRKYVG